MESLVTSDIENRDIKPFLSICIPTFNRAAALRRNLESIFIQIGNSSLFEVIVVNNNSTDQTEEVVKDYQQVYSGLIYKKNDENIGMSRNILLSLQQATGKYCMLHGDDDYFAPETLYKLVEYIEQYPECGVYFLNTTQNLGTVSLHKGINEFLKKVGILATAITTSVIRREDFEKIEEPEKFIDTMLNQIYINYSILIRNPNFLIINNKFFLYETQASGERYDWGEVFIKNYLLVLSYFIPLGLDEKTLSGEKKKILDNFIMVYYGKLKHINMNIDFSHTLEYFEACYKDEPYFQDYHEALSKM